MFPVGLGYYLHLLFGCIAVRFDQGGWLSAIGIVWAMLVEQGDQASDAGLGQRTGFISVQADAFLLKGSPEALDKDVFEVSGFSDH